MTTKPRRVAVATSSQLAADAAMEVHAAGGNAVDCALAAALMTMNTEPGVCALAGGAYVTIWGPGIDAITIDGNVGVPGAGLAEAERRRGTEPVTMAYGAGIRTLVGAGTVGVPGSLAAVEHAWQRFGSADWRDLFIPVIRATREGFPLSLACHYYLGYSGTVIFGRSEDGYRALHDESGRVRNVYERIVVPHLADTLERIADEGAAIFYTGPLAERIVRHVRDRDGMLTAEDMATYRAIERPSLIATVGDWQIASNPPPAVGGSVLTAMLDAFSLTAHSEWTPAALADLVRIQFACLDYRREHLDLADDVGASAATLLAAARAGQLVNRHASASTVHTSAVDDTGLGCAVTASSGYGSGEMPAGTGLWLNNCLGELELNRRGLDAGPVGARLPSNMAPTVCRPIDEGSSRVMAVGSPGADRITTALAQALINHFKFGWPLDRAIGHPRLHVDTSGDEDRLMIEPGLDVPGTDLPQIVTDKRTMYFGGVSAALFEGAHADHFTVAADPRREGGTAISNSA